MTHPSRRQLVCFLGAMALLGCASDEVGGPANEPVAVEHTADIVNMCTSGLWALIPGSGISLNELSTLANNFNAEVIDAPGLTSTEKGKLRRIGAYSDSAHVPSGRKRIIKVHDAPAAGTAGWCGSNDGYDDIEVKRCDSGNVTQPAPLQYRSTTILHELWNILNDDTNKLGGWVVTSGCSTNTGSYPTTSRPCVHEVQYEYDYCGVRPVSLTANSELYTGVGISGPTSLDEGEAAAYDATFTQTGGSASENPEWVLTNDPAIQWSSNSLLSLSCTNCNPVNVTGVGSGSGTLSATLSPAGKVVYPVPRHTTYITVGTACTFSPSSSLIIPIGSVKTFYPSSTSCSTGVTATLTPSNGSAGFSQGSACSLTSISVGGLIKVRGCQNDHVTLTIRRNGAVVQTIDLIIGTLIW